jgi:hypothetical protein
MSLGGWKTGSVGTRIIRTDLAHKRRTETEREGERERVDDGPGLNAGPDCLNNQAWAVCGGQRGVSQPR